MILARVHGTIVTTVQHPLYHGRKQLLVRALRPDGSFDGERYLVAIDIVDAGVGETVLVIDEGNCARQLLNTDANGAVRSVIVGIVDQVSTAPDNGETR